MIFISWNVNGIRAANKNGFYKWFSEFSPDFLCLQETKARKEQLDKSLSDPDEYYSYWNSALKKGYSGVATFCKKKPLSVKFGLGNEKFDDEGRIILCEYDDYVLFNVYFPNGQRDHNRVPFKLEFYDLFLERCQEIRARGKHIIACGDYNTAHKEIDLKYPKANKNTTGFLPVERAWIDKFIQFGYVDTFRHFNKEPDQYTWWTYRFNARERNIGWRLDYFFVNKEFLPFIKNAFILNDIHGSDHCPVGLEIDIMA